MGRATIEGGGTGGLYQITIDVGSDRLQALIESETERLAVKQAELFEAQTELDEKEAKIPALVSAVTDAMDVLREAWEESCTPEGYVADPLRDEIDRLRDLSNQLAEITEQIAEIQAELPSLEQTVQETEKALDEAESALDAVRDAAEDAYHGVVEAYWDLYYAHIACADDDDPAACEEWAQFKYEYAQFQWELIVYEELPYAQGERDEAYSDWYDADQVYRDAVAEIEEQQELLPELEEQAKEAYEDYAAALIERKDELSKCQTYHFIDEIKAVDDAMAPLAQLNQDIEGLRAAVELLEAQIANLQFQLDYYALLLGDDMIITREAWCADLVEDVPADTLVTTMEIPGERQAGNDDSLIIAPQYWGDIPPDATQGQLISREVMSPAQAAWNFAVLPGWQKWRPMYRVGWLTSVDYESDTGSVELDESVSSAQSLPVNQEWPLDQIPIEYMYCNAAAFFPGDRVVVRFYDADWHDARIIGFERSPRECTTPAPVSLYLRITQRLGTFDLGASGMCRQYYLTMPDGAERALYTVTQESVCVAANEECPNGSYNTDPCGGAGTYLRRDDWSKQSASAWLRTVNDWALVENPGTCVPCLNCIIRSGTYEQSDLVPLSAMAPYYLPPGATPPPATIEHYGHTYTYSGYIANFSSYKYSRPE